MTVKKERQELFYMKRTSVAYNVRKVLSQNPPYQLLKEILHDKEFVARFKPYWWGGANYIKIRLDDMDTSTRIIAEINSSWYIFNDTYAVYNKLIEDVMLNIKNCIESSNPIFVYRYSRDTVRFLQLLGISGVICSILILFIGLIWSMYLKIFLPAIIVLFISSILEFGYGVYEARKLSRGI